MDATIIDRLLAGVEHERKRDGPPAGFPALPDIASGRYRDKGFLRLETEHLWNKAWLYAAHTDEFPHTGSYKLWQRTGSPILLIRDRHGRINAFYNTCRHRGGPIVMDDFGTASRDRLVCGYHGWTYDLGGNLVGVPDKRDFVDLDMSCRGLLPVRSEALGNWVFVNEDPAAPPLLEYLGPLRTYFEGLPLESLRLVRQETFEVPCHYKILQETFFEVYHLKATHGATVDRFLNHRGTNIVLWPRGHSLMLTPNRHRDWVDPGTRGLPELDGITDIERHHNPSFNIYPNLVTPVSPSGLPFLLSWPVTERSMLLDMIWFAPGSSEGPQEAIWQTRINNFNRILGEDIRFAGRMQTSLQSNGFRGAALNYQERRIYHWHEELDRRIGTDLIPDELRVPQVMGDWIADGW